MTREFVYKFYANLASSSLTNNRNNSKNTIEKMCMNSKRTIIELTPTYAVSVNQTQISKKQSWRNNTEPFVKLTRRLRGSTSPTIELPGPSILFLFHDFALEWC